tara:strand:- start:4453 stop:5286 length:834 start_codon:yes stop_codon:yes gene_type:complete
MDTEIKPDIHTDISEKLGKFITSGAIPNIIFHGVSGSGKRSILYKFISKIYNDQKEIIKDYVMFVNCAQGKGIKFIREDLKLFAKIHINTYGGNFFKSIILLNADKLTIDAQSALRRCIEVFSHTTRFFIVVEDKYKLLKPILSRFCEIYVPEPVFEDKVINLHKFKVSTSNGFEKRQKTKMTLTKKIISGLKDNLNISSVKDCVNTLYHKGLNTIDVITYFEGKSCFPIDDHKKACVLFHFNQYRREFRNEMLSMFFILYCFLLCSDTDLENILFM